MTIGWFGLSFTAILSQRKPNQPLYNSHLQLLRAFALALLYVISWQILAFSHKNQAASRLLIVNFFTILLQYNSTYSSHCSPIIKLNFFFLLLTLSPLSFTLSLDSNTPLFSLFSIRAIYLPTWSISLSGCRHGSDRRSGFPDRRGGMVKWRSAWRHLLLSVLFISPSSLSACHRGCFLSLVAVVGLIGVMGLYGNVEIDVAVRLRWRSVRWVWVGFDRVFFFFFWWLLWPMFGL